MGDYLEKPFDAVAKASIAKRGRPASNTVSRTIKRNWLPGIFYVRTIVDACADTPSRIVYVGDFRKWSEEVEAMREVIESSQTGE